MPPLTKTRWAFIYRENSAALAFLAASAGWFVFGTIYGLFSAIDLVAPDFFRNVSWLAFSRVRPMHVNTVLFGFAVSMLIGCGLYYLPYLLRTRLWSQPLAWIAFVLWNITVASGPPTFGSGHSQGREYTEYLWIFDVLIVLAVIALALNCIMTILRRRIGSLHVAVWYFTGTFLWTVWTYPIGNVMWRPKVGAMPGLLDSILLWFWGHTLPGLLLTPLAIGAAIFVIPRVVRQPVYSGTLSALAFWTLVGFYTHIGGHHIMQAPIPAWLKTMSAVDSMAMVIPVFAILANLWLTARGNAHRLWADIGGRFVLFGTLWYLVTCVQGPLQSLPFMQKVTHFNNWTIGHSHIAILGFTGFIALGGLWHVLPRVTRREIWSLSLARLQFWLITVGLTGFFIVLTIAGIIQGTDWYNGEMVYETLPRIVIFMILRASLGLFIVAGAGLGLFNLIMTARHGRPLTPSELDEVPS